MLVLKGKCSEIVTGPHKSHSFQNLQQDGYVKNVVGTMPFNVLSMNKVFEYISNHKNTVV